jgi:hypothetical protein
MVKHSTVRDLKWCNVQPVLTTLQLKHKKPSVSPEVQLKGTTNIRLPQPQKAQKQVNQTTVAPETL